MPTKKKPSKNKNYGATLGFEEKLWAAADKMRGHVDSAEYKHVVLGLLFLRSFFLYRGQLLLLVVLLLLPCFATPFYLSVFVKITGV